MTDLFGENYTPKTKTKKIHPAKKHDVQRVKQEFKTDIGLNSVYKDFGKFLSKKRGNKIS